MVERRAQTIAYPADRDIPYPEIPAELTRREWIHSVLPGIGVALVVFCAPVVVWYALYGVPTASASYSLSLASGGSLTGALMVVRYVTDVGKRPEQRIDVHVNMDALPAPKGPTADEIGDALMGRIEQRVRQQLGTQDRQPGLQVVQPRLGNNRQEIVKVRK